jgi:hypothetical protein
MAVQRPPRNPSEAETVYWLKRTLEAEGLGGRRVRHVLVDRDPAYVSSAFARRLEPMGSPRIGSWRPDLVCTVDHAGSEYLAGFEVKGASGFERGVIQAGRYRDGVHEAYLCVARNGSLPEWIRHAARQNGVGLLQTAPNALAQDAVHLVVEALQGHAAGLNAHDLAWSAHRVDEALARALFGPPPEQPAAAWNIKPWSRFKLKANLYDTGILDSPLGPGVSGGRAGYDPRVDWWRLGSVMSLPSQVATYGAAELHGGQLR